MLWLAIVSFCSVELFCPSALGEFGWQDDITNITRAIWRMAIICFFISFGFFMTQISATIQCHLVCVCDIDRAKSDIPAYYLHNSNLHLNFGFQSTFKLKNSGKVSWDLLEMRAMMAGHPKLMQQYF